MNAFYEKALIFLAKTEIYNCNKISEHCNSENIVHP